MYWWSLALIQSFWGYTPIACQLQNSHARYSIQARPSISENVDFSWHKGSSELNPTFPYSTNWNKVQKQAVSDIFHFRKYHEMGWLETVFDGFLSPKVHWSKDRDSRLQNHTIVTFLIIYVQQSNDPWYENHINWRDLSWRLTKVDLGWLETNSCTSL